MKLVITDNAGNELGRVAVPLWWDFPVPFSQRLEFLKVVDHALDHALRRLIEDRLNHKPANGA
jgi:hypothetical protein